MTRARTPSRTNFLNASELSSTNASPVSVQTSEDQKYPSVNRILQQSAQGTIEGTTLLRNADAHVVRFKMRDLRGWVNFIDLRGTKMERWIVFPSQNPSWNSQRIFLLPIVLRSVWEVEVFTLVYTTVVPPMPHYTDP